MFARWVACGAALIALAMSACGDDDGEGDTAGGGSGGGSSCEPTEASVSAIFAEACTASGCHNASEPAVGLDLESEGIAGRLVDQAAATCDRTLVVPQDAGLSFLYEKLTSDAPECGDRMPIGARLSDDQLTCIRSWIEGLPPGCETCGGSGCADLDGDVANCGDCGVTCPTGATCEAGSCMCGASEMACGDLCVAPQSDPDNCGMCGKSCPPVQVCSLGDCKMGCDAGLMQCGQSCVDTQTNPNHCGDCDTDCGTGTCAAGTCDCGNGIDTNVDPDNCGTCGNVCPPGQTCEAGECTCGTASVSFSSAIQPILTANCATIGCHRAPMPKEGLDLSNGAAYGSLVNAPSSQCGGGRLRVAPGDPGDSYMMDKILGVDLCFGSKMPKMGSVPNADIEAISNWICGGAEDN
jgi:hypothetical protein